MCSNPSTPFHFLHMQFKLRKHSFIVWGNDFGCAGYKRPHGIESHIAQLSEIQQVACKCFLCQFSSQQVVGEGKQIVDGGMLHAFSL